MQPLRKYLVGKKLSPRSITVVTKKLAHIRPSTKAASQLARLARSLVRFEGSLPPADVPVSVIVLQHDPRVDTRQDFIRKASRARRILRYAAASSVSTPCLANPIRGSRFVPRVYFSGYDDEAAAFVFVTRLVQGHSPRSELEHVRAEHALISLWILGISLKNSQRADILVHRGSVTIVDVFGAAEQVQQWRRNKAATTLRISDATKQFAEWEPPAWLRLPAGAAATATIRQQIWTNVVPC